MARKHRGDENTDFDLVPGSSRDTPSYARRYDPQGEREYTNLPENAHQIELEHAARETLRRRQAAREERLEAMGQVQYIKDVGKFVRVYQPVFAAHLEKVHNNEIDIHFDPARYPYFDQVIAETYGNPALFDPRHKDYAHFEDLRNNLAVLRNYYLGKLFDDGSFDPGTGDEQYIPHIEAMAESIGEGLRNDRAMVRWFTPSINTKLANIEAEGAAEIYRYVQKQQPAAGLMGGVQRMLLKLLGHSPHDFDLPPIEETPFGMANLYAPLQPLPSVATNQWARSDDQARQQEMAQRIATGMQLAAYANSNAPNIKRFRAVEEMDNPARLESIELAREILRRLRDMQFSDKTSEEFLDTGKPDDKIKKAEALAQILAIHRDYVDAAKRIDPDIAAHPKIQESEEAAGALTHSLKLMAAKEMPSSIAAAQQISADITQTPDKWKDMHNRHIDRLLTSIEGGLEQAVGAMEQQQEQDEEMTQEVANDAMLHHQGQKKRKRKKQAASVSTKKAKKATLDIMADDFTLKQGRFQVTEEAPRDTQARNASEVRTMAAVDLAKIKELGKSLRDAVDNAATLKPVNLDDKIAPDERGFAGKQADEKERPGQNNQPGMR